MRGRALRGPGEFVCRYRRQLEFAPARAHSTQAKLGLGAGEGPDGDLLGS